MHEDLDLSDIRVDNDVTRAHDLSDDGTTNGGRDDDDVCGTDPLRSMSLPSDLLPGRRERC